MLPLLLSLLAPVADAAPQNVFGGRVVDRSTLALSTGMPSGITVDARLPMTGTSDLGLGFTFDWADHGANFNPGAGVLVDGRIRLHHKDQWDVALRIGTRLHTRFVNGIRFSVDVGNLGALATLALSDKVDINMGMEIRPTLWVIPGADSLGFSVAVPLHVGTEISVADNVRVGANIAGGPAIAAFGDAVGVGPWVDARIFVSFGI